MILSLVFCLLVYFTAGCGGQAGNVIANEQLLDDALIIQQPADLGQWPAALPVDAVQPWEATNADGIVVADRTAACVNTDSLYCCGAQRFDESDTGVTDNYDATQLTSGNAGANGLSWASWRLAMEGAQPGVVTCDVNVQTMNDGALSGYYVGLSNYGTGAWEWYGPYSDHHVGLSTGSPVAAGGDYLSPLGNLFVMAVAYDGAVFDVVAVAANPVLDGDTAAPDIPGDLTAEAVTGGLRLSWDEAGDDDLAGYRVYYGTSAFTIKDDPHVETMPYLIGCTYCQLPATAALWAGVTAVDINGHESGLSNVISSKPQAGTPLDVRLTASRPSGLIQDVIDLTATGAASYDWDLDGDGVFETVGDTTSTQQVDTAAFGVIRPAVLGKDGDGCCGGGVSVLIGNNSRPVADAHAAPAFGAAPLSVTFTGTGVDDDGEIASYSWDFADDGFYDYTDPAEPNPPVQVYDTPGTYHVKFRVEDDLGSWDVDTLIINVSDPDNSPPEATLAVGTGEERGNPPHTVWLDASGSTDEDGTIVEYLWDLNGDGVYDKWSTDAILEHVYVSSGVYDPVVRVEDDQGAQDTATINVTVNFAPVADLDASSTHGDTPFSVEFSAAASTDIDGTIADYEWDLDGDGVFNETGDEADAQGGSTASYTYSDSGIYDATVRVTDNEGLTDTDGLEIKATGWVVVELPYYYNDTLMGISMTLVDGNPAIAFQTWQMFDCMLFYTRSSTSTGTQAEDWLHRIAMARGDEMGHTPKLRIVNGTPACIYAGYIGVAELYLYFTRAATVTGKELESWSMPSELAGSTDADSHDLAEIDGNPAFAVEIDNNTLEYWRSSNTTGTPGSWSHITFTGLATNFDYVELETISGNPAILSVDSAGDAYYMRSTTSTGASLADWTAAVTLPLTGGASDAQQSLTFIEVSGNPAVCYRDVDDDYLYYQRSTTTTGTSAEDWTQTANVSNTTEIRACQMAVVDGKPAIAYLSSTWDLCYAHSSTAAGSSTEDWSTDSVCSAGPGKTVCLIDNDGKPAIAFRDDYYLMYAYYID